MSILTFIQELKKCGAQHALISPTGQVRIVWNDNIYSFQAEVESDFQAEITNAQALLRRETAKASLDPSATAPAAAAAKESHVK
jgi:hypothetical protein